MFITLHASGVDRMNVLVTGSNGFIARNLIQKLETNSSLQVLTQGRGDTEHELFKKLDKSDFVFHLAGVNRSKNELDFELVNVGLTKSITEYLKSTGKLLPIVFSSSTQAGLDNIYGRTKSEAESLLFDYVKVAKGKARIYRLPNVFGKWSRPHYNSVIATFCFRIAKDLEVMMPNPEAKLRLVYVADVVKALIEDLQFDSTFGLLGEVSPVFETTVGEAYLIIKRFKDQTIDVEYLKGQQQLRDSLKETYIYFSTQYLGERHE